MQSVVEFGTRGCNFEGPGTLKDPETYWDSKVKYDGDQHILAMCKYSLYMKISQPKRHQNWSILYENYTLKTALL